MSYLGNEVMPMFDYMADTAAKAIIPTLAKDYCDLDRDMLLEIWNGTWEDFRDEFDGFGIPSPWKRIDCYYVHELFDALETFVLVAMENDY